MSVLNALAVTKSKIVCSVPIFMVYDSHLYRSSWGEIECNRRTDCSSPIMSGGNSVRGGIAKSWFNSFLKLAMVMEVQSRTMNCMNCMSCMNCMLG